MSAPSAALPPHIAASIAEHARAVAAQAPEHMTSTQRDALARTFIPSLRAVREEQAAAA